MKILDWYFNTTDTFMTKEHLTKEFSNKKVILKKCISIRNYYGVLEHEDIILTGLGYAISALNGPPRLINEK